MRLSRGLWRSTLHKHSTGLVGLPVNVNARQDAIALQHRLLDAVKVLPQVSGGRAWPPVVFCAEGVPAADRRLQAVSGEDGAREAGHSQQLSRPVQHGGCAWGTRALGAGLSRPLTAAPVAAV